MKSARPKDPQGLQGASLHRATPKIPSAIENSGLKVTLPRLKVLEIFEQSERRHLCAEDIYRIFMNESNDVSLATIYRVLTQFEQAGILRRQNFEGHKATYELNNRQNHDHFLCSTCGRVEEFESSELSTLVHKIAKAQQYKLTDAMVYLNVECLKKNCPNRLATLKP